MKPHLTWLISLPHALKIVKKLQQKRHRDAGYTVELEDIDQRQVHFKPETAYYAKYSTSTYLFRMNIYYEKPHHEEAPQPNKTRLSSRVPRK